MRQETEQNIKLKKKMVHKRGRRNEAENIK